MSYYISHKVKLYEFCYVEDADMEHKKDFERDAVFEAEKPAAKPAEDSNFPEDLLPEFVHYQDEGCELASSCLHCPFPRCIEEKPWTRLSLPKKQRNMEIIRLHAAEKKSINELAALFRVSARTVRRALAEAK
jgi:hypothetical protein